MLFYEAMELNRIQVRTEYSEVGLKTCASIVCGRHYVRGYSDDSDDELEEEFFYGAVRHILKYGAHPLLYVTWFKVYGFLGDDQLGGLAIIPVRSRTDRSRDRSNGWIHASNLALQQHLMVGKVTDGKFYIVVKI